MDFKFKANLREYREEKETPAVIYLEFRNAPEVEGHIRILNAYSEDGRKLATITDEDFFSSLSEESFQLLDACRTNLELAIKNLELID